MEELTLCKGTADANIMKTLLGQFGPILHVFCAHQHVGGYFDIHDSSSLQLCVFIDYKYSYCLVYNARIVLLIILVLTVKCHLLSKDVSN